MAQDAQVPVIASVRAAFGFFTQNWSRFGVGAALAALGSFMLAQAMAYGNPGVLAVGAALWFVTVVAYRAALFRFAFTGDDRGPSGLRLSGDEKRLAIVTVLSWLFLSLVFLVAATPVMLLVLGVVYATADPAALEAAAGDQAAMLTAMGPLAETLLRAGAVAVGALVLFVYVRLCLFEPATIAEGRIIFLKSWPWTAGSFWRVLAALILASLPGFAGGNLLGAIGVMLAEAGAGFAGALFALAGALVSVWVGGMMSVGVLVFLYRGLRPAAEQSAA